MKTLKYLSLASVMPAFLLLLAGCNNDGVSFLKSNTAKETMTLAASVPELTLDPEKLFEEVLTFTWTDAREMPDEYLVSYISKLDVLGNQFSNAIRTPEDGVYSKSYTTMELQNILVDKWKRPSNRPTTIEFEILAKWSGGTKFVMPEVRTTSVVIQPYRPVTFDVDEMFVNGSAVPGSRGKFGITPESEFIYVWTGHLVAGDLNIEMDFGGNTNYLYPVDQDGAITNDETEYLEVNGEVIESWAVTEAGEYKVIVDVKEKTLKIMTPGNILQPAVVEWPLDGVNQVTTVTGLWVYGESTGWGWGAQTNPDFKPSLIDPQVFYYEGSGRTGRTKIGVHPHNQSYVFSPFNDTGVKIDNVPVEYGTEYSLSEGYIGFLRDTYFGLPSGTNYMVVDIRNKKATFGKR